MPPEQARSPARLLAPLALVAVTLALIVVLFSSGTDDGDGDSGNQSGTTEQTIGGREGEQSKRPAGRKATYTVKKGDTLGEISQSTDVPVEKLQALNPDLDPQGLVAGQKIKLGG